MLLRIAKIITNAGNEPLICSKEPIYIRCPMLQNLLNRPTLQWLKSRVLV